jgi:hypothetical protein
VHAGRERTVEHVSGFAPYHILHTYIQLPITIIELVYADSTGMQPLGAESLNRGEDRIRHG